MRPKKGERVLFPDGHAQTILDVTEDLDDTIVHLKRGSPKDDDWVYFSHIYYTDEYKLWRVGRNA